MCYSRSYYRIGKGENLSCVKRGEKANPRDLFRFSSLFLPWFLYRGDVFRTANDDDIHHKLGPRQLTLSTPHLLVADAEQVSHLSTCQKEKLINLLMNMSVYHWSYVEVHTTLQAKLHLHFFMYSVYNQHSGFVSYRKSFRTFSTPFGCCYSFG